MKHRHECAEAIVEYAEQDMDGNPKVGLPAYNQDLYLHGHGTHHCGICSQAPISALSDYGYWCWSCYGEPNDEDLRLKDFCHDDDTDEPEWVGCCWKCWREILEADYWICA